MKLKKTLLSLAMVTIMVLGSTSFISAYEQEIQTDDLSKSVGASMIESI